MRLLASTLVITALSLGQPAAAQAEFSEEEVSALARVAMPRAFQSIQQKCRPALPANAYIYDRGNALRARLQGAAAGSWPEARGAIIRLAARENPGIGNVLRNMPPEALQPFADEMVAGMVLSRVETGQCAQIDRVLELLDPLPPENLAELIGLVVVEAQNAKAEDTQTESQ